MERSPRVVLVILVALLAVACQSGSPPSEPSTSVRATADPEAAADELRQIESDRVAALVAGDAEAARPFFSPNYWLIDPTGGIWARDDYLAAVGSGGIEYISWEPESDVSVRIVGDAAILRYRALIEVDGGLPAGNLWHTDYYERVDGRWVVVWSQATAISE